jgi:hypothetical protein
LSLCRLCALEMVRVAYPVVESVQARPISLDFAFP